MKMEGDPLFIIHNSLFYICMRSPLTKIIYKALPAVVSIAVAKDIKEVAREIPHELLPFIDRTKPHLGIPEENIDENGLVKMGGGSGFFASADGIVLTNKHVVSDGEAEYSVITDDDRHFSAKILARDPIDDVAILKVEGARFARLRLGDSSRVELGEEVLAIGNALGLFKNSISSGIISGRSRSIHAAPDPKLPVQELRGLLQTDAAINPGNSGGPLVNMRGEAIGINTAIVSGAQNLSFTIPINAAKRDLADLKKYGKVRRPLLGLRYLIITDELQKKMKLPVGYGALVMGQRPHAPAIIPYSPAAHAGFRAKDIVLECDGKKITNDWTIQDILEEKTAGNIVRLKTLRAGSMFDLAITLAERK